MEGDAQDGSSASDVTSSTSTSEETDSDASETSQPAETPKQALPELQQDSDDEDLESLSDVSNSPDVADVHFGGCRSEGPTREDATLARIDRLRDLLTVHPLVPRDPRNPSLPLLDMASGVRLPDVHCAFQGCNWCEDVDFAKGHTHWGLEWRLFKHLMQDLSLIHI